MAAVSRIPSPAASLRENSWRRADRSSPRQSHSQASRTLRRARLPCRAQRAWPRRHYFDRGTRKRRNSRDFRAQHRGYARRELRLLSPSGRLPRRSCSALSPGGERHSRFIGKHDCLEPNGVLHRALTCPDNRRQAWGDCKVSSKTLTAQGWCRRFCRFEIDCGRGSEPRTRSRQWNSPSNGQFAGREKGSQSRESFKPHGQPSWRPSAASLRLGPANMRGHFLFLLLDRR